jgi:hypothetical protein
MPIFQKSFEAEKDNYISMGVTYTYPKPSIINKSFPFNQVANFIFKSESGETFWFSPEKFLYHYWTEAIEAEVLGKVEDFTKYQVHYNQTLDRAFSPTRYFIDRIPVSFRLPTYR